nr:hypothetical protein [Trueperaceae bacterium]
VLLEFRIRAPLLIEQVFHESLLLTIERDDADRQMVAFGSRSRRTTSATTTFASMGLVRDRPFA